MGYAQKSLSLNLLCAIRTILNHMRNAVLIHPMRNPISLLIVFSVSFLLPISLVFADTASVCPFTWERNLKVGSTGEDVLALQKLLNADSDTLVADAGAGSPGNESDWFGSLTKAAVITFQEKYADEILAPVGLSKGTGTVGPSTRAKLNALCSAASASGNDSGAAAESMT